MKIIRMRADELMHYATGAAPNWQKANEPNIDAMIVGKYIGDPPLPWDRTIDFYLVEWNGHRFGVPAFSAPGQPYRVYEVEPL